MGIVSDAAQNPGDVMTRLRNLERRLDELTTARGLEASSIGAGGLRINGGTLRIVNPDGVSVCFFGPLGTSGGTSRGWAFRHDDDSVAFTLQGAEGNQFWALWDKQGHIVISSDADSGEGLARPWIPLDTPHPNGLGHWPGTNSGSWSAIATSYPTIQHPRLDAIISTHADDGTRGEVRVAIDGKQCGPVAKAGDMLQFSAPIPDYEWDKRVELEIQGRRTSGNGEIKVAVRRLVGRQS